MIMRRAATRFRIRLFWFTALIASLLIGGISASEQIQVGYRDFSYPAGTGSNSKPTGEKPESKLWFNDGVWWGVLWSTPGNAYQIHGLDLTTQDWLDTGTVVDARTKGRVDVLWDPTVDTTHPDGTLYVASHVYTGTGAPVTKDSDRGKLYRFSYDKGTKTYTRDTGFPVNVTGAKSESLVLAKDATGRLWVTYVESNRVMVNHSLGDDLTWATPFVLPGAKSGLKNSGIDDGTDDIASIVAYDGNVGIMWSRQTYNNVTQPACAGCNVHSGNDEGDTDHLTSITMNFAVHNNVDAPSVWTASTIYTASGDDHINLKAFGGHIYAAFKEDGNAKVIGVLDCATGPNACRKKTDWKYYPVYKTFDNDGNSPQADVKAVSYPNPTRPSVLIDTDHRVLYVFVSVEQFEKSAIYYKKTSLDAISFDTQAAGVPFIQSATDILINDPTSTKQNVNITSGLVVLASDQEANHYFHNYLPLK
jgi:hypothetical protein